MSYVFDVIGWENANYDRIQESPTDPTITYGVRVHVYDPENPEDQDGFWARPASDTSDWDWDDWYEFIIAFAAMYGIELG